MTVRNSKRLLPSTSMLVAFDAAARTNSFTLAAKELSLTQGAISRQITALEQQLSLTLFHREKQSISLTETGKLYAKEIHSALNHIRSATLNIMTNPNGGLLNLAVLPMFGSRWLMPRLADFLKENSQITMNTVSKVSPFDFNLEAVDGAIHYGKPNWSDANCTFLMAEETLPVCSPALFEQEKLGNAKNIFTRLLELPLLHISTRPNAWQNWFNEYNVKAKSKSTQGMHFEQFSITTNAAIAGLGVALLPKFLIENELARGELVIVCQKPLKSQDGYYLVTPHNKLNYAPIVAFKNWLIEKTRSN